MDIDPIQLLTLLQWTDSSFPTGAFAHSGGLETYAQADAITSPEVLLGLITVKLHSAASSDLIAMHVVMAAAAEDDFARLMAVDELLSALKVAREPREASEKVGRRMLANVLTMRESDALLAYRDAISAGRCAGHHAVVHGLACAALGLTSRTALLAFAYGLAANQTAAALKLIAIGQTQAQAVLAASAPAITRAVDAALGRTLDDVGGFTPGLDIRAVQHETLFRRLFIS
jgi:urease accessory protein